MKNPRGHVKRLLLAAGLTLATLTLAGPGAGSPALATGPQPSLSPLRVQAGGTEATLTFTSSVPTAVTVENKPATAPGLAARPLAPVTVTAGPLAPIPAASGPQVTASGAREHILGQFDDLHILRQYTTTHEVKLTGLRSNTRYDLSVTAETQAGERLTARTSYATAKKRVRVTLREINIKDDGDWFYDGEPGWVVKLSWSGGSVAGCFPNTDVGFGGVCQVGSYGEGHIFPRNNRGDSLTWIFAEENFDAMPAEFKLHATAKEEDWFPVLSALATFLEDCLGDGIGCGFSNQVGSPSWKTPQGVEWASTPDSIVANDNGTGFESVLTFTFELFHDNLSYPSARNAPSSTWRSPFGR